MEVLGVGGDAIFGNHGVIVVEHRVARRRLDATLGDHAGEDYAADVVTAKNHIQIGRTERARTPLLNDDVVGLDSSFRENFRAPRARDRAALAWVHSLLVDHEAQERARNDTILRKPLVLNEDR